MVRRNLLVRPERADDAVWTDSHLLSRLERLLELRELRGWRALASRRCGGVLLEALVQLPDLGGGVAALPEHIDLPLRVLADGLPQLRERRLGTVVVGDSQRHRLLELLDCSRRLATERQRTSRNGRRELLERVVVRALRSVDVDQSARCGAYRSPGLVLQPVDVPVQALQLVEGLERLGLVDELLRDGLGDGLAPEEVLGVGAGLLGVGLRLDKLGRGLATPKFGVWRDLLRLLRDLPRLGRRLPGGGELLRGLRELLQDREAPLELRSRAPLHEFRRDARDVLQRQSTSHRSLGAVRVVELRQLLLGLLLHEEL